MDNPDQIGTEKDHHEGDESRVGFKPNVHCDKNRTQDSGDDRND